MGNSKGIVKRSILELIDAAKIHFKYSNLARYSRRCMYMYLVLVKDDEEYKNVSYPGVKPNCYQISNWGNIRKICSDNSYKQLKPTVSSNKYYHIGLATNVYKKYIYICIHRLVAWEFCSGYNPDLGITHVNHINSSTHENYYENLEWVTPRDNMIHAFKHGNKKYVYHNNNSGPRPSILGSKNPNVKFDEVLIHEICRLIRDGLGNTDIYNTTSLHVKVNFSNGNALIKRIKSKKSWTNISSSYF